MPSAFNFVVVIQDLESRLYLKNLDSWTQDIKQAMDFKHIHDATLFASKARLSNCHIVMSFGDPQYDVTIRYGRESMN